mmetsp:Transcript_31095/g.53561  ORF Transcript_31095/g.53561 Transcript_31095/m.53561 type:complete len:324 (-) Transcript_31095:152-1123(-)
MSMPRPHASVARSTRAWPVLKRASSVVYAEPGASAWNRLATKSSCLRVRTKMQFCAAAKMSQRSSHASARASHTLSQRGPIPTYRCSSAGRTDDRPAPRSSERTRMVLSSPRVIFRAVSSAWSVSVAEKKATWASSGRKSPMTRLSPSAVVCRSRSSSASSSTSRRRRSRLTFRRSSRSRTLSGAASQVPFRAGHTATHTCGARERSHQEPDSSVQTRSLFMWRPISSTFCPTCSPRALVGTRMSTCVSLRSVSTRLSVGHAYAAVLPLPAGASAITSMPLKRAGIDAACTGEGLSKPIPARPRNTSLDTFGTSLNDVYSRSP